MYYIGPLLFWAWAEMTAGFFILSVPCLPRLLAEAPLPLSVKIAFGLSRDSKPSKSDPGQIVTIGGSGGNSKKRRGPNYLETTSYEELDEFNNTTRRAHKSESQESLNVPGGSRKGASSTQITSRAVDGSSSGSERQESIH